MPSAQGRITVRRRPKDGEGVSITSQTIKYAKSESGTEHPTGGWSASIPAVESGWYLWTWTQYVFSDGTVSDLYSASRMGTDGTSVRIDLDNDNDTMVYSGSTLKSGYVTANISLYVNNKKVVSPPTFYVDTANSAGVEVSDYTLVGNVLTVKNIRAVISYITIYCDYDGARYTKRMNIKKLVGQDKYEIGLSSDVITYNTTSGKWSESSIDAWVTETPTNSEGSPQRLATLQPTDTRVKLKLILQNTAYNVTTELNNRYSNGSVKLNKDNYIDAQWDSFELILQQSLNGGEYIEIDRETVMIAKVENGNNGKNVTIHLDNQNDSLLYDSDGNRISSPVTSNIELLVNGKEVTPTGGFRVKSSLNVGEPSIAGNVLTVSACTAASGYAVVACTYDDTEYTAKMSILRRVDTVKYTIRVSDTSFTYNETTGSFNKSNVVVAVYREDVSTKVESVVSDLSSYGLTLKCSINGGSETSVPYANGQFSLNFVPSTTSATFVLYKGEDERDRQTVTISHVKDAVSYVMQFDPPFISIPVDPNKDGMPSIGFLLVGVGLKVLKNGEEVDLASNGISKDDIEPVADIGNLSLMMTAVNQVTYTVPHDTLKVNIATKITVTITPPAGSSLPEISGVIPIQLSQRGLTGAMGDNGDTPLPYGTWDVSVEYTKPTGILPIVWCEDGVVGNNGATTERGYWALEADKSVAGNVPKEGSGGWKKFNMFEYTFSKVSMAAWAQFAQAIFQGNYMFSSRGVDAQGNDVHYSAHKDDMFDENGNFATAFTPYLTLDLSKGHIKGLDAEITGIINATSGVFKNIKTPNENFSIDEGGTATFKDGKITMGGADLTTELDSDGRAIFAKGNIEFGADGSGSICKDVLSWGPDGTLSVARDMQELYVDVIHWGAKGAFNSMYAESEYGYRLNTARGNRFDLHKDTRTDVANIITFVALPDSQTSGPTSPEGYIVHGTNSIILYNPDSTTREGTDGLSVYCDRDARLCIKERSGRSVVYTPIAIRDFITLPPATPVRAVYGIFPDSNGTNANGWILDFT